MRLLLVEDDVMVASGIKLGLTDAGYAVDWVGSGERAEDVLRNESFDAAIIDIGLPGMDGLELTRRLRRPDMPSRSMPVLILTARDALHDRVSLQAEVNVIRDYILLEQLRMLHPVSIGMEITTEDRQVPPMLLMPFIENLFKHGVDKLRDDNHATISLILRNDRLIYSVQNKLHGEIQPGPGVGLSNLEKRLYLLYKAGYRFQASAINGFFHATLEIPV